MQLLLLLSLFLNSGRLLGEVNATITILLPKVSNPSGMGDYRPISYGNIIYKCITKNLTNSLKSRLNDIISPTKLPLCLVGI